MCEAKKPPEALLLRDSLNAVLNLSGAKCAQELIARAGLRTLVQLWSSLGATGRAPSHGASTPAHSAAALTTAVTTPTPGGSEDRAIAEAELAIASLGEILELTSGAPSLGAWP